MQNTIQIKRRLQDSDQTGIPTLLNGELAYNEQTDELYYGGEFGTLTIAGSGAYVDRVSTQSISGDKTFEGSTTLKSTTFSSNSVIDFGGNVLTNVAAPASDSDAATKLYVDSVANGAGSATEALSAEIYNNFVKLTDDRAVTLSGGLDVSSGITVDTITTSGNAQVGGKLTVVGDLEVQGSVTSLETTTTVTSAFSVTNAGTSTALTVEQTGSVDIAEFKDDGATALIIKDGGNVGIGTATPNEKLTVSGNISASGTIFGAGGIEISSGNGATTLYVEDGKVGINTETPSEALTISGSISASNNVLASGATFSGAVSAGSLDINCFSVDGSGNIDTCGTLSVGGATTLSSTLSTVGAATFDSSVTVQSTLDVTGASTFASTVSAQGALTVDGATTLNSTLNVAGASTFGDLVTINSNTTTTGSISGTANSSYLVDFIIDGGMF